MVECKKSKEYKENKKMEVIMVLAKVTSKGQVTVPVEIRKNLMLAMAIKYCFMKMNKNELLLKMQMLVLSII